MITIAHYQDIHNGNLPHQRTLPDVQSNAGTRTPETGLTGSKTRKLYSEFGYPELEEDGLPPIIRDEDFMLMDFGDEPIEHEQSDYCPDCGKLFYADDPTDEANECNCSDDPSFMHFIKKQMLLSGLARYRR